MKNPFPILLEGALGKINPARLGSRRIPFFWRFVLAAIAGVTANRFAPWPIGSGLVGDIPFLLFYFPTGLIALVGICTGIRLVLADSLVVFLMVLAWILYLAVVSILFLTPRRNVFWMVYGALLILLALNVQGCQMMKRPNSPF